MMPSWWVTSELGLAEAKRAAARHAKREGRPEMVHAHPPDQECTFDCMGFLP